MDQDLNLLTKEYLLKISPDISIFERYDKYYSLNLITTDMSKTFTDSLNSNEKFFNRILYRVTPKINHERISSPNSFIHVFDSGDATYIIAICNRVKSNSDENDYVIVNIENSGNLESITGVGF